MTDQSPYRAVLLDHFHNPRNKGDLETMQIVHRGSNPRCGDKIEVGIVCRNGSLEKVRFRGRGCSICLASASMMTECTQGIDTGSANALVGRMQDWFGDQGEDTPPTAALAALAAVRPHSARKKCVLLAWQALAACLAESGGDITI